MIDSLHFRQLIHSLEPRYTILSRSIFRDQITPVWQMEIQSAIHDDLKQVDAVALTTDGWTSRATEPYNTITAHYVKDCKLTTKVLQTEKMMGSHTGENLATELDIALEKWGRSDKVTATTVDNAGNIGKACTVCRGCEVKVRVLPTHFISPLVRQLTWPDHSRSESDQQLDSSTEVMLEHRCSRRYWRGWSPKT